MKTRNFIVMIFALGWLILIGIIPVFGQDENRHSNYNYNYVSPFGIGFERFGWDWHLCKIGAIGKPFGFGFSLMEGYKPYQIPKSSSLGQSVPSSNKWLSGPFDVESSEILDPHRFFPISLYFSILTWDMNKRKDEESAVGSILLYVDDSFWNRIFRNPTVDYRNEKLPLPRLSNTEFGIWITPFGAFLSLKLFYKKVSISPGIIREWSSGCSGNVCYIGQGGNSFYYFPGYNKDFIGIGVEIILGGNWDFRGSEK